MIGVIIFIFGAVFGSFIGAWTYRLPRKIKISEGRSFCPKCKAVINWYDNIPLLSFLLLGGKCRSCHKKIGFREPAIELSTALTFITIYYFYNTGSSAIIGDLKSGLGVLALPYLLAISFFLIAIFVIDLEHKIIPDEFSFSLFAICLIGLIGTNSDDFYLRLFISSLPALFLLFLHGITRGRGMGLGDVKLVLFAPLILGSWQNTLIWMMGSFIIGAVVGVLFIISGKASFGKQIPFGPFLIISFFLTLLFSDIMRVILDIRY